MTMLLILFLGFPLLAAGMIRLTDRRDTTADPRLTMFALLLVLLLPLFAWLAPKCWIFPGSGNEGERGGIVAGVVVMTWSAGVLVSAGRLIVSMVLLHGWRRRSRQVRCMGGMELRELDGLGSPVALGVFRRIVLLPGEWKNWSPGVLRMVLVHELAHHRRGDPFWRWVVEWTAVIHWYHPSVLWLRDRWVNQCEFACDARVLAAGVLVGDYARILCDFAAGELPRPAILMASHRGLESRIRHMLGGPSKRLGTLGTLTVALILAGCAAVLTTGGPSSRAEDSLLRWSANPFPENGR